MLYSKYQIARKESTREMCEGSAPRGINRVFARRIYLVLRRFYRILS